MTSNLYINPDRWEKSKVISKEQTYINRIGIDAVIHPHPFKESCAGMVHIEMRPNQEPVEVTYTE